MLHYIIMSRSLTYAQRASKLLERSGITATVKRAPQSLSGNGCGYCVGVSYKHGRKAVEVLDEAGLSHGKTYMEEAYGTLREAVI